MLQVYLKKEGPKPSSPGLALECIRRKAKKISEAQNGVSRQVRGVAFSGYMSLSWKFQIVEFEEPRRLW